MPQKLSRRFVSEQTFLTVFEALQRCFKLFQLNVALHIETSQLICSAKQITVLYIKRNADQRLIKLFEELQSSKKTTLTCSFFLKTNTETV